MRRTFLTNHARALLCIADDPQVRLRVIAQRIGITERAVQILQRPRRRWLCDAQACRMAESL